MKIKCGYSMGYAGTDTEWEETVPDSIVKLGQDAIDEYIEQLRTDIWQEACEKISVWADIEQ